MREMIYQIYTGEWVQTQLLRLNLIKFYLKRLYHCLTGNRLKLIVLHKHEQHGTVLLEAAKDAVNNTKEEY